jgi:plastocyanin
MTVTRRWSIGLIALALTAAVTAACGDDSDDSTDSGDDTGAQSVTITASDFQFDSTSLTLEPGEVELTLVNDGEAEHSFTSDDLDAEVEAEGGEEASTTFTVPEGDAEYEFHCEYHPDQMTGMITVGSGAGAGGSDSKTDDDKDGGGYDY